MDLLETLKSAIARKKNIERKDGNVHISSSTFSGKTLTCVKKFGVKYTKGMKEEEAYYSLDCLIFFWKVLSENPRMDHGDYATSCADNDVDAVSYSQRDALFAYLNGKSSKCEHIDLKSSLRYAKPISLHATAELAPTETSSGDMPAVGGSAIQRYKRLRAALGNEKVYETRAKVIAHNGKMAFNEVIEMMKPAGSSDNRKGEEWGNRMGVGSISINPEEGFLTQTTETATVVSPENTELIIMVPPSGGNNVLSMFNIREFMEFGRFVPSDEMRKKSPTKPMEVVLNHTILGKSLRFRFVDNHSRLSDSDWSRVVCVITGSQAWQFRGWKISDPATLFSKVLGVFIWFNEMPMPPIIKGWNVRPVYINRDVRNMDMVASVQLWDMIEKVIKTKRMDLLK